METNVYNQSGKEVKKLSLPAHIFGLPWNSDLVHQVHVSMTSSARSPIAHAKTRGEVRGGGKKPWRQKGTGQARHGSTRSPIWVGGGVTHGPRNDKNYDRKVNRKMKAKALFTLLSRKYRDGEVFFLDSLSIPGGKTKNGVAALKDLIKAGFPSIVGNRSRAMYISLGEGDSATVRGLRNVGNVEVAETRNMSPLSLLEFKHIVIVNPDKAIAVLDAKGLSAKEEVKDAVSKPKAVKKAKKAPAKKKPARAKAKPKAK